MRTWPAGENFCSRASCFSCMERRCKCAPVPPSLPSHIVQSCLLSSVLLSYHVKLTPRPSRRPKCLFCRFVLWRETIEVCVCCHVLGFVKQVCFIRRLVPASCSACAPDNPAKNNGIYPQIPLTTSTITANIQMFINTATVVTANEHEHHCYCNR